MELVYACILGVLVRMFVSGVVVDWGVAFHEVWRTAAEDDVLGVLF
jgi:hypothetical protein